MLFYHWHYNENAWAVCDVVIQVALWIGAFLVSQKGGDKY
jgi:hypothetical protein